ALAPPPTDPSSLPLHDALPISFVTVSTGIEAAAETAEELRQHVGKDIGPIAKPKKVHIVTDLPKTRSGKIMRRLLKDVAENREIGNTMTLADASVMETIEKSVAE